MSRLTYTHSAPFRLENGSILPKLEIAYQTWGTLNADKSNVVWVCHALTANADVVDWWPGLVGDGCLFNPSEHFIVCANVLGSCYGSTNSLSINPETNEPYYHDFPHITIRDIVSSLDLLRQHLEIEQIYTLIGGSLGGQQALEWAISKPTLIQHLIPLATNAYHSAWGIAFNESQRLAIAADATWQEKTPTAGINGLKAARAVAMLSYRNYQTYHFTQSEPNTDKVNDFLAASYQDYQGEKLTTRFDAFAYFTLSKAMDSHQLGRDRGSVTEALAQIQAKTLVIGVTSDILFPLREQIFLAEHIPSADFVTINSTYGHDGFLIETQQIAKRIQTFFDAQEQAEPVYARVSSL
ncbi:MAG: homoserine O-acetyltransferase MetX [Flammeovirgaceae bacterium]